MKSRSRLLPLFVTLTMLLPAAAGLRPRGGEKRRNHIAARYSYGSRYHGCRIRACFDRYGTADLTFAGETVSFLVRGGLKAEFVAESITGEVVNDAVLARNRTVEERLGCQLNFIESRAAWSDYNAEIRRVDSGADRRI